ncbi:DUF4974 domain-containing protein [Candidatus Omnitrophota bacterium]
MANRKRLEKIVAILFIVILQAGCFEIFPDEVYGQVLEEPPEQDKASEAEDIASQPRIYTSDNENTGSQVIKYFIFEKMDIRNIFNKLSNKYGLEIVYPESISCSVTILLHDVTVQEALDSLADRCGFVYEKKGTTVIIKFP